jgi:signal transduction histidine kinase/ligand-binding sensor domain-containing protein/DNA-binding response OmpR family regulator
MFRLLLLVITLLVMHTAATANNIIADDIGDIALNHLPLNDRLPSNSVYRIFQDSEGLLWFGTIDGLCRYDGSQLLTFRTDISHPNLLTDNFITCFAEDSRGHLLIGTRKGVSILDKMNYHIRPLEYDEIKSQDINTIITARDSTVWIGTNLHLYRFRTDFTLLRRYDDCASGINHLFEDNDGNIWISAWCKGLYRYNKGSDSLIKYPKIGKRDNPFRLFQDNKNSLWICSWGDGLYYFVPNANQNPDEMYVRQELFDNEKDMDDIIFFDICQDSFRKYIWVMSYSGLFAMKYTADNQLYKVDISKLFRESNNIFSGIMNDNTGNLWIATYNEGVLNISFDNPTIENYPVAAIKEKTGMTSNITVVYNDRNGIIRFNQNRCGLGWFDPADNSVRFFNEYPALRNLTDLSAIRCISGFRSLPDEIWVGTEFKSMIFRLSFKNKDIRLLQQIDLKNINKTAGSLCRFFEDRRNNIWIVADNGLYIHRHDSTVIELFADNLGEISDITEDTYGNIWISTSDSGVYSINNLRIRETSEPGITNYRTANSALPTDHVATICADLNGKILMATDEGHILVFNNDGKIFTEITNYLNIKESILKIVADDFGHIWFMTERRIAEYNPSNGSMRDYSAIDGVGITSFRPNAFYKDPSGKLFFGGNKGISVFTHSDVLSDQPKNPRTLITDIKINMRSVYDDNNNSAFDAKNLILNLKPADKNIEISFSSLNYSSPSKIKYAFMMQGIDDEWVYTDYTRCFAIYNQLKKGNYTFLVKATDQNNLWSDQITRLIVHKAPAFYESPFAFLIYTLIFITVSYMIFIIVRTRVKLDGDLRIARIEKEKSEELTQIKLRYFTNISHDFMTPLTIISCLTDDAEQTLKGNFQQFEAIRSNVSRLHRLLQQVIDFRKIEYGRMELSLTNGDIALFIKDICYTDFLPLMEKKNIRFSFTAEPAQIPACFDADKIDKIVFNLLSNALKYTPLSGEVSIKLFKTMQERHPRLKVQVRDTGEGIEKENIELIFRRFYTNRLKGAADSNGIGLSIVKELLDLHHGEINVESEIGKGSVFTFNIPIDRESYNSEAFGHDAETIVLFERNSTSPRTYKEDEINDETSNNKDETVILIAEDNEDLRNIVSHILSRRHQIMIASNGKEAIECVNNNHIDIIISDVMMPEMDGLELCHTLKQNIETSHIPVLLLTVLSSMDDRIACYNAGADGYITKPFDLRVLEARINNFIAQRRNRQRLFRQSPEINISTLDYPSFDERFLNNAVACIEKDISNSRLDVDTLASALNLSRSSLYRKLKSMTDLSPNEFIRNIRLKHACCMLKESSLTISEIAYELGFSDPRYFSTSFKKEFNLTPSEFRDTQPEYPSRQSNH